MQLFHCPQWEVVSHCIHTIFVYCIQTKHLFLLNIDFRLIFILSQHLFLVNIYFVSTL